MVRQPDYSTGQSAQWAAVDAYFTQCLVRPDEALNAALAANVAAGLPTHDVSAPQGKMLHLFVRMCGARRVLEIGTLGGYSTIWIARALPQEGVVTTIEANQDHAQIAKLNIERAGIAHRVELRTGLALDVLPSLEGPYDLIFIDADKPNNPNYLRWALKLSRPGTVIIGDNVVRGGAVVDPLNTDLNVKGVRAFFNLMAAEPRLSATAIQTAGEKGWDGFALAIVD